MISPPQTWPLTENLHLAKAAILMPIPTAHVYYSIALGHKQGYEKKRKDFQVQLNKRQSLTICKIFP